MTIDQLLVRVTRVPGVLKLWRRYPIGSVPTRVRFGVWRRPEYAYGLFRAAELAKSLKLPGVSALEFGVAGGNGLVALEAIAREVSQHLRIPIDVYGFDTGAGMPAPRDYRDLPHVWDQGFYPMDVAALRARLETAKLILGDVEDTVPAFIAEPTLLPVGFIAFDLDFYSSTQKAFRIFSGNGRITLPRVYCYFDDIFWPEFACHNEYVGELCAIREFNEQHEARKLLPLHLLRNIQPHPARWHDQIYVFHNFQHPLYCVNIAPAGWGISTSLNPSFIP